MVPVLIYPAFNGGPMATHVVRPSSATAVAYLEHSVAAAPVSIRTAYWSGHLSTVSRRESGTVRQSGIGERSKEDPRRA